MNIMWFKYMQNLYWRKIKQKKILENICYTQDPCFPSFRISDSFMKVCCLMVHTNENLSLFIEFTYILKIVLDDLTMKTLWLNYIFSFDIVQYQGHYGREQSRQMAFSRSNVLTPAFVPKVTLQHSHVCLFMWCRCLHSRHNGWAEEL